MVDHKLAANLDRHRDALMAIPGVVGVGLGHTVDGPVIQLFVQPSIDQDLVRRHATAIVANVPMSVVGMFPPNAMNTA